MANKCLFIDDYYIEKMENINRIMHQPKKKGAVIKPEKPWEDAIQTRCAPQWDENDKKYKLLVFSVGHMNYLESSDGIDWQRPLLQQKEFNGSYDNNIVTYDARLEWPDNVIENMVYDPDDSDISRRYKAFRGCLKDRQALVSLDGIHYHCSEGFSLPSSDESNLSYDSNSKTFIATLKCGGPNGRSHNIFVSKDFKSWEKISLFHADDEDQKLGRRNIEKRFEDSSMKKPFYNIPDKYNVDIYNLGLFKYEDLYIGMPSMYHQTGRVTGEWEGFDKYPMSEEERATYKRDGDWGGFHHIQLICSRDLKNWERLGNRRPFIDLSPPENSVYDTTSLLPPSCAVKMNDELWFYYSGLRCYGGAFAYPKNEKNAAICLAVLRNDGFVSLDAGNEPGSVLTKPLKLKGKKLSLNVNAVCGFISVKVLDHEGQILAASEKICKDSTDIEVMWENDGFNKFANRNIRLLFELENAELYSYKIE